MRIRTYQPGDEVMQTAIFNAAAGDLFKFKPATVDEVKRRIQDPDFDPTPHFYAEEKGQVTGYVTFHASGRVGYPWFLRGREPLAIPLFQHMLGEIKNRGIRRLMAAYRREWSE